MRIVRRTYDTTEMVLWWALAAVVAVGAINIIYRAPEAHARVERQLAAEISEENRQLCERRGLVQQSHEYVLCTLDLNAVREKQELRVNETLDLF